MSLTISDLPTDCWNEVLSHVPQKQYPVLLCTSSFMTQKTIAYVNEKTTAIFNQFKELVHKIFPQLFSFEIGFTASNLVNLKKEVRFLETDMARVLSKIDFEKLKDPCKKAGLYEEVSWVFYLASLLNEKDFKAVVRHGYWKLCEFQLDKDELIQLAMTNQIDQIELKNLPESYLNQMKQAILIAMLREGKIEKFLEVSEPNIPDLKVELADAYAIRGDIENSLKIYDLIGNYNYKHQLDCLIRIGVSFAKASNFRGILEVESRVKVLPRFLNKIKASIPEHSEPRILSRAHIWPSNFGDNEIYRISYFEKIVTEHWQAMFEEPFFEPLVLIMLVQLDENEKVKEYIKRAPDEQRIDVFNFLIRFGKGFLVENQDELFQDLFSLNEFEQGIISNVDSLENKWVNSQNVQMTKRLIRAYLLKQNFKKALFLNEIIYNDKNITDYYITLGYIANFKAKIGDFRDLGLLARITGSQSEFTQYYEVFFSFALEDSFNPKSLLDSGVPDLKLTIDLLLSFLIKKGNKKGVDLFFLTKEMIKRSDTQLCVIGKFCAENGFIDLAREAAEQLKDKNQLEYYELLLTIRLQK